jgi:hypothetical protein
MSFELSAHLDNLSIGWRENPSGIAVYKAFHAAIGNRWLLCVLLNDGSRLLGCFVSEFDAEEELIRIAKDPQYIIEECSLSYLNSD